MRYNWFQRFFLIFRCIRELRESRQAARKKNQAAGKENFAASRLMFTNSPLSRSSLNLIIIIIMFYSAHVVVYIGFFFFFNFQISVVFLVSFCRTKAAIVYPEIKCITAVLFRSRNVQMYPRYHLPGFYAPYLHSKISV